MAFQRMDHELNWEIYLASSKGHNFILVATDYFTKWVEVIPLKKVEQKDVIQFIKEHIIQIFGIPRSITVAPPYLTQPRGRTRFGDADQFYHIYIFKYCKNKCCIIVSVKEGPPFCQLTLSFNMTCMLFQHYHLQNIIRVNLHK